MITLSTFLLPFETVRIAAFFQKNKKRAAGATREKRTAPCRDATDFPDGVTRTERAFLPIVKTHPFRERVFSCVAKLSYHIGWRNTIFFTAIVFPFRDPSQAQDDMCGDKKSGTREDAVSAKCLRAIRESPLRCGREYSYTGTDFRRKGDTRDGQARPLRSPMRGNA